MSGALSGAAPTLGIMELESQEVGYSVVLDHLAKHAGEVVIVLAYGRGERTTPVLRLRGPLGEIDMVTEWAGTTDDRVGTAGFRVGGATLGLNVEEFDRASYMPDLHWLLIEMTYLQLEVRFTGERADI